MRSVHPTVIIDHDLQQKYPSLQLNAQAFYAFAAKTGFTDTEIAGLTIHFTSRSSKGLAGRYLPRSRKVEVYLEDILAVAPDRTGKLGHHERRLPRDVQYSKVLSRVLAHEVGHHSRAGRTRGRLATVGSHSLLAAPLVTLGVGTAYVSATGNLATPLAAFMLEASALTALSYRQTKLYGKHTNPEKLFNYHRRRFSEKPAFAIEAHTPAMPLVTISL